eukprot:gene27890-33680_t
MHNGEDSLLPCLGKSYKSVEFKSSRVIAHIDLDCFYVQVERSLDTSLVGKPVAVVQYNPFGDLKPMTHSDNRLVDSGSIIAVSYEARAQGVKRIMRGQDAKKVCPDMILVQVPTSNGKADLTIYRQASAKIMKVLSRRYPNTVVIERASIDEVYLDVSQQARMLLDGSSSTFVRDAAMDAKEIPCLVAGADSEELKMSKRSLRDGHAGTSTSTNSAINADDASAASSLHRPCSWLDRPESHWSFEDKLLLAGVLVVRQLRADVWEQLGFTCSAGIAPNKMLAKLASAMHKPNKQTVVPRALVPRLLAEVPYSRIQGFGGKLGAEIMRLFGEDIITLGDLAHKVPRPLLTQHFGEDTAEWIANRAQGEDDDDVQDRAVPISIGCSKSFRSVNTLIPTFLQDGTVLYWLTELAQELFTRMKEDEEQNCRLPKLLHLHFGVKALSRQEYDAILKKNTHKKVLGHPDSESSDAFEADLRLDEAAQGASSTVGKSYPFPAKIYKAATSGKSESEVVADWWEGQGVSLSKVTRLPSSPSPDSIAKIVFALLQKTISNRENARLEQLLSQGGRDLWGISYLGLAVTQFEQVVSGKGSITTFLSSKLARDENASKEAAEAPMSPNSAPLNGLRRCFGSGDADKQSRLSNAVHLTEKDVEFIGQPSISSETARVGQFMRSGDAEQLRDGHLSLAAWGRVKRLLGDDVDIATFEELPEDVRHELLTASYFQVFEKTAPPSEVPGKKKSKTSRRSHIDGSELLTKWLRK